MESMIKLKDYDDDRFIWIRPSIIAMIAEHHPTYSILTLLDGNEVRTSTSTREILEEMDRQRLREKLT